MRLAFLGTPEPAAVALRGLVDAGHDVRLVVTRADKRRGRHQAPSPSPVKAAAGELGLAVSEHMADVVDVGAELGVVVAYGRIIPVDILDRLPLVNVHFSLLPRWRGAAPVERAVLAGDRETGVCLMALEAGLDTGPVYRSAATPIDAEETVPELRARLADLGTDLLVAALSEGLGTPVAQSGEVTYAAKVRPDELELDWSRSAEELHRVVRVGRAWTTWRGRRLLVLEARVLADTGERPTGSPDVRPGSLRGSTGDGPVAATGRGGLRLIRVQPEGRPAVAAADWLRGARPTPGEAFAGSGG